MHITGANTISFQYRIDSADCPTVIVTVTVWALKATLAMRPFLICYACPSEF
jgi:hypothetical protein